MKDKGTARDSKMTSLELSLSRFEKGYVYDEWFEMTPAGNMKIGGKLRLRIQITPQASDHSNALHGRSHHWHLQHAWSSSSTFMALTAT